MPDQAIEALHCLEVVSAGRSYLLIDEVVANLENALGIHIKYDEDYIGTWETRIVDGESAYDLMQHLRADYHLGFARVHERIHVLFLYPFLEENRAHYIREVSNLLYEAQRGYIRRGQELFIDQRRLYDIIAEISIDSANVNYLFQAIASTRCLKSPHMVDKDFVDGLADLLEGELATYREEMPRFHDANASWFLNASTLRGITREQREIIYDAYLQDQVEAIRSARDIEIIVHNKREALRLVSEQAGNIEYDAELGRVRLNDPQEDSRFLEHIRAIERMKRRLLDPGSDGTFTVR